MITSGIFTESALVAWGMVLAPLLQAGDIIALNGELGAGKTTLARAILQGLGADEDVPSPSFTLVQCYDSPPLRLPAWHVDLYRLSGPDEALELGLEDAYEQTVCLIEWPDRLGRLLPASALRVRLTPVDNGAARRLDLAIPPRDRHRFLPLVGTCTE